VADYATDTGVSRCNISVCKGNGTSYGDVADCFAETGCATGGNAMPLEPAVASPLQWAGLPPVGSAPAATTDTCAGCKRSSATKRPPSGPVSTSRSTSSRQVGTEGRRGMRAAIVFCGGKKAAVGNAVFWDAPDATGWRRSAAMDQGLIGPRPAS